MSINAHDSSGVEALFNVIIANQETTNKHLASMDSRITTLDNKIESMDKEMRGDKDTPSVHFRLSHLEKQSEGWQQIKLKMDALSELQKETKDWHDIKIQVKELVEWKRENQALKKTTVETIIKSVIPWIVNIIIAAAALYLTLGVNNGN